MEHTLANLAVLITGPMVGVEIAVALFTNPVFDRLPDAAYRLARSRGSRLLGRVMPFWYIAVLVVLAATAWTTGGQSLITAAAAVMAVVVLLTVTAMVPINNQNTGGVTGLCLEVHDLAISKYVAGRPKDLAFTEALAQHGLTRRPTL